ncbi:MAG: GGDEF domain-containing protein [Acidobacteriales bacterium]|nr:GGDEF domain-containing protein [Terriglobales bacterium]
MNITAAIGRRSRVFASAFTVTLSAAAVAARYVIPPRFSVAFLFLVPVSFATWFLSWETGSLIALAATLFLFYFDRKSTDAVAACWSGFMTLTVTGTFIYIFTELRDVYARLVDSSRRDPLTGLLNGRAFREMMTIEINRMSRYRRPLTIAYLDVDDFKNINDRYGHLAGDEFLREVARQMTRRLRVIDCLARVGGDEFAIVLPETDQGAAQLVFSELHRAIRHLSAGNPSATTVSIGAVTFMAAIPADTMIAMADRAMYEIKQSGKNNIGVTTAAIGQQQARTR